jgi:hypothetical protein
MPKQLLDGPDVFVNREFGWWSLLPDLLVVVIPLGVGLYLSIVRFDWILLSLMVGLVFLAFPGNGFVRGKLACCHCRQRELGCAADRLFQKREGAESH